MYLDEWNDHLIRIGLKLILAQEFITTTIVIPDYYFDYLNYDFKNINSVIQNTQFPLKNYEVIIEYCNCLKNYIQSCNSGFYEQSGYLLLIVIILNLSTIPKQVQIIIQTILAPQNVKPQLKNIVSFLSSSVQTRRTKLISESYLLIVTGYLEQDFISLQVIQNNENDNKNITVYQECLDNWNLHLLLAEKIRINGQKILKSYINYRQFIRKKSKVELISNQMIVRFIQYYQLTTPVLKCIIQDQNWKSQLISSYQLQDELLRSRLSCRTMEDLQQIRFYLESIINLQMELIMGHYILDQLISVEKLFRVHQETKQKDQIVQQSMLERNREMLRIKWQNLQAGIKVQNKITKISQKKCIRIEEQDEEEDTII